jgi:choline dehydrogenase-like flavoprotein
MSRYAVARSAPSRCGPECFHYAGEEELQGAHDERFDAIIIGTGFGGSMTAHVLVHAGLRVLMLERGDWLERGPHNWEPSGILDLSPNYTTEAGYQQLGEKNGTASVLFCVGGLSVYYGGVSLRLREQDFHENPEVSAGSGGRWPYGYDDLEPYYLLAERVLGVAGDSTETGDQDGVSRDPTAPRRSAPYPYAGAPLSHTSSLIARAALQLGLHPFQLPLAINRNTSNGRPACVACMTCDAFPCAIGAKNDMASAVLPPLIARGLRIETNVIAARLVESGARIERVECVDRGTGESRVFRADQYIVSAGSLGSAHLLLASELQHRNPGGVVVGRYLMRHCNGIIYGLFGSPPNPAQEFHKQLGIHDFYLGDGARRAPAGKLGSIQQVHSPPVGLALTRVPRALHRPVPPLIDRTTGLLVIAEDQARFENHVTLDARECDPFGLPRLVIHHRYTKRDRAARAALLRRARQVLRQAGARLFYVHTIHTFSHAVGSLRMGEDPRTSALDHACRFRGIDNLRVLDGSFFPASGGLNPSLTIAANALRAADLMVDGAFSRDQAFAERA